MNVAAIVYEGGSSHRVDAMLGSIARELIRCGARIAGAVQINEPAAENACAKMALEELTSGRHFDISICKRPGEKGCSLDATALEDVAGAVAGTLPGADLLILNRFGKQEVAGEGFRDVIQLAVAEEIPVMIAVNSAYEESWAIFAGPEFATLAPEMDVISAWCQSAIKRQQGQV